MDLDNFCEQWMDVALCMLGYLNPAHTFAILPPGSDAVTCDYWIDRDFGDEDNE